jgi:hypothetical protein
MEPPINMQPREQASRSLAFSFPRANRRAVFQYRSCDGRLAIIVPARSSRSSIKLACACAFALGGIGSEWLSGEPRNTFDPNKNGKQKRRDYRGRMRNNNMRPMLNSSRKNAVQFLSQIRRSIFKKWSHLFFCRSREERVKFCRSRKMVALNRSRSSLNCDVDHGTSVSDCLNRTYMSPIAD